MTRIDRMALQCMDLEWFGVDQKGHIGVFCSAGKAKVPEFVCADEEKCCRLMELFDAFPTKSATTLCFIPCKENHKPVEVAEDFSGKGFYYYDSDDGAGKEKNLASLQEYYTINSRPVSPIYYQDLSSEMKDLLKDQFLPVEDFEKCNVIML